MVNLECLSSSASGLMEISVFVKTKWGIPYNIDASTLDVNEMSTLSP